MTATADPEVFIESRDGDATIYVRPCDGLRWRVTGTCDRRGDCLIGAVIDGEVVRDKEHLAMMCLEKGEDRIDSELDVPVGPNFSGCCPFITEVLSGD